MDLLLSDGAEQCSVRLCARTAFGAQIYERNSRVPQRRVTTKHKLIAHDSTETADDVDGARDAVYISVCVVECWPTYQHCTASCTVSTESWEHLRSCLGVFHTCYAFRTCARSNP